MNNFETALKDIDDFCQTEKIKYAIIGGLELIAHDINKTTDDVDINLLLKLEDMNIIGNKIISNFNLSFLIRYHFLIRTSFFLSYIKKRG